MVPAAVIESVVPNVINVANRDPVLALNVNLVVVALAVWLLPVAPTITGYNGVVDVSCVALIRVDGPATPDVPLVPLVPEIPLVPLVPE